MKIRRGIWVSIGLIALLAAAGSLCRLALPGWIEKTVTRHLSENLSAVLGTGISVRSVEVVWPRRELFLYDFRVAQPEGFGDAPFIGSSRMCVF
jgi:hypothetical protein